MCVPTFDMAVASFTTIRPATALITLCSTVSFFKNEDSWTALQRIETARYRRFPHRIYCQQSTISDENYSPRDGMSMVATWLRDCSRWLLRTNSASANAINSLLGNFTEASWSAATRERSSSRTSARWTCTAANEVANFTFRNSHIPTTSELFKLARSLASGSSQKCLRNLLGFQK